ncbi:uncharacterized protein LOC105201053 isoform X2 [Solenopsis invicta]|nr:uncharacterized protein LOC105201053 isoform X2 [Solenopsis invicta]XP_039302392.1 uncharacterized protein LOC105201053 isoform X2 [Solenopsis invicta]
MNRKPPIRTYQRKKTNKSLVTLALPTISHEKYNSVENSRFDKSEMCNNSLNYDLFETTFDRVAKGAVVPPMPLENKNYSWRGSSSDSDVNDTINLKSPECIASNFLIHSSTSDSTQVNHKIAHKRKKRKRCEPEIMTSSGILSKKTRVMLRKDKTQSGQKTKANKIQRKKMLENKLSNGQKSITNSNVTNNLKEASYMNDFKHTENDQQIIKPCFVKLNTHIIQNYMLNREKIAKSKQDVLHDSKFLYTDTLQTNRNISQVKYTISRLISTNFENFKRTSIKQCCVALNDNIIKDSYVLNNKKNMEDNIDIRDKSNTSHIIFHNLSEVTPNCNKSIEFAPNNIRKSKNLITECFVKLERLRIREFVKKNSIVFNKQEQKIVSSTPIGSQVKPTCSVIFSPINNIDDESHWKKCLLATTKEDMSNIDRRNCCSSIHEAQTQVLLSQKPQVSMNFAVNNEITTCKDDIHVVFTQKFETEIPHSLNISLANSTSQSRSLFSDITYNHSTKRIDEDNIGKKDLLNKFIEMDLIDLPVDLKREQSFNSNTQTDARKIPNELLKNKYLENYDMERHVAKAICEKIKDESINVDRSSLFDESWDNIKNVNARVLLTRLQDPIRIGRRTRYSKWHLSMLNECSNNEDMRSNNEILHSVTDKALSTVRYNFEYSRNAINSFDYSELSNDMIQHNATNRQINRSVFLKPGKSWSRSLSILNNVNDGANLDKLSVGKGKKWRHSVRNILDMQKKGIFQSCLKEGRDDTDLSRLSASNVSSFNDNKCKNFNFVNYPRFSKRISIRVVPNNTSTECDVKDTPFLEAFGITAEKSPSLKLSYRKESLKHDQISSHSTTARDVVLQRCLQKCYISFAECFPDSYLEHCYKIGEGVYGEVFLYECDDKKSVIKIIPIESDQLVNGEPQKKFNEILSEIVIAKELDNLKLNATHKTDGFVEVKNISCIIGKYPEKLIKLWNIYDNDKTSDNDCPSMFTENQLYIALELCHGGDDLEAFIFQTAEEACALFLQTALALAVAEKALEFEHRDLHWGNILISRTKKPYVYYNLDGKEIKFPSKGVKVSIIDFTLSRMLYQGCCIYNDLALDPALFTAHGEYQFEIYRLMREKIQNNWRKFEPYTNVLWLHYVLDKMITAVRYKRKNLKVHKQAIVRLKEFKDTMLNYESAYDFIINSNSVVYL